MRTLLAVGTLVALVTGVVPAHAIHGWLSDGVVCREACAGTDHCCCKRRQLGSDPSRDRNDPPVVEPPPKPCCEDGCATLTALRHPPSSRASFRAEVGHLVAEAPLHHPDPTFLASRDRITPPQPRAPPA